MCNAKSLIRHFRHIVQYTPHTWLDDMLGAAAVEYNMYRVRYKMPLIYDNIS